MEGVVEDVEDERQTKCCPANDQGCEDSGGCDGMRKSLSVHHSDGLSRGRPYQGHHSQADNDWEYDRL